MCARKVAPRVRALRGMWADRAQSGEGDASGGEGETSSTRDARPSTLELLRPRPTSVTSSTAVPTGSGRGTIGSGKGGITSAARSISRYDAEPYMPEPEEMEASSGRSVTARTSTFGKSATARRGEPLARGSSSAGSSASQLGAVPNKGASKGRKGKAKQREEMGRGSDLDPESDGDSLPTEPSIFHTGQGERYHFRLNCYGLRQGRAMLERLPCPRRLSTSIYGELHIGTEPGIYHLVRRCAGERYYCLTTCRCCMTGRVV